MKKGASRPLISRDGAPSEKTHSHGRNKGERKLIRRTSDESTSEDKSFVKESFDFFAKKVDNCLKKTHRESWTDQKGIPLTTWP